MNRSIATLFDSRATSDGDGVKIRRISTPRDMQTLDPFLLLDEIASDEAADYIGGFPSHPHRGFETVTYMRKGAFTHKDHMGNEGHLKAGGVQWMTAGKGVIHSEMPEQNEGSLHGFQIWVNLPAKDKMQTARYQGFEPNEIPEIAIEGGGIARIIAGSLLGKEGPVINVATAPSYFDISLETGNTIDIPTTEQHNSLIYLYKGRVTVEGQEVTKGQLAQLTPGNQVTISANTFTTDTEAAEFLFLSGEPINEPIAHYGPFVMNTREEIDQALSDYRSGTLCD